MITNKIFCIPVNSLYLRLFDWQTLCLVKKKEEKKDLFKLYTKKSFSLLLFLFLFFIECTYYILTTYIYIGIYIGIIIMRRNSNCSNLNVIIYHVTTQLQHNLKFFFFNFKIFRYNI